MQLEAMYPGEDGKKFVAILLEGVVAERAIHVNSHNSCGQHARS